ncbi:uncharacterized protein STEHIDRAFT_159740 [Stereum hirsutum FP-91666 SS1]|uniref:uncharacterized protein n=1 Tax=Stereum hirsutum (strain FP-91666) TaxID=721885 RepID=UPI000444A21B|nr:uncharacterized protein STEHIDRAFT_159740 [Stereum hirsutum FP-91666 SS1]EIM84146.1 hypothetical protein STEHIDRAFT_159740 [Stereum hirsutum FP-91666 SS1]
MKDSCSVHSLVYSEDVPSRYQATLAFGIFKRKFYLLIHTPEFDLKTQAKIVAALAVIFNFIRIHDPEDINVEQFDARAERAHRAPRDDVYEVPVVEELGGFVSTVEKDEADSRRDGIAERMWADYKEYLQNGGDEEEVDYDELYM